MLSVFIVDTIPEKGEISIIGDEAHHAAAVVRIKEGDELLVTDGRGSSAHVRVKSATKKIVRCEVLSREMAHANPTKFIVVQALTKGDRARETIELLTEAGVDVIVPWAATRSIGKGTDKFAVTAREASKQSRRFRIPEVTPLATTNQICEAIKLSDLAIAFHESATHKLSDQISSHNVQHLLIIIGPEGGITDEELAAFEAAGAKVALMGRPILRSAHAGIAAVSAVSALLKVW